MTDTWRRIELEQEQLNPAPPPEAYQNGPRCNCKECEDLREIGRETREETK